MFGFLIKKWFFDLWDNILPLILVNLGAIALLAIPALAQFARTVGGIPLAVVVIVLGVAAMFVYIGGVSGFARDVADFQSLEWRSFFGPLRENVVPALVLFGLMTTHVVLVSVAAPFYQAMGNMLGLVALAVLFWISVLWLLVAQFYLPVIDRLERKPLRALRKAALVMFDNTAFAIGVALGAVFILFVSVFTALLIPGVGGLVLWFHVALRLRLYKYDYLEEHPETARRDIPWDALLLDDRERVGKRTLRGMIFPWKE